MHCFKERIFQFYIWIYSKVSLTCQSLFICFQTCLIPATSSFKYFYRVFSCFFTKLKHWKGKKEKQFWIKIIKLHGRSYLCKMHHTILFPAILKLNLIINWPTKILKILFFCWTNKWLFSIKWCISRPSCSSNLFILFAICCLLHKMNAQEIRNVFIVFVQWCCSSAAFVR